ncbi:TetR/AcrR family transcriptional regulator [Chachezhania sediminis]|uniref:TetR/AcrR family transcriptional regulator n=1 Tax=Chachezhania sediminis TaxID=2599291 RepID=UPI00131DF5B5|nr:TetR/AcrR family transcriptional regulator [Chachezhania sediminis]
MARPKSEQVRQAILDAAHQLFMEKGYTATTIGAIARQAGTAQSNVYVYFQSKFDIGFAVFDPWMRQKVTELEEKVGSVSDPQDRLHTLVEGLLHGIASDPSGQTMTLVQVLATVKPSDEYDPELLMWTLERIREMIGDILPGASPAEHDVLTQALMLSFDGIALRQNLRREEVSDDHGISAMLTLMKPYLDREKPAAKVAEAG